jgi:hypothetical protein
MRGRGEDLGEGEGRLVADGIAARGVLSEQYLGRSGEGALRIFDRETDVLRRVSQKREVLADSRVGVSTSGRRMRNSGRRMSTSGGGMSTPMGGFPPLRAGVRASARRRCAPPGGRRPSHRWRRSSSCRGSISAPRSSMSSVGDGFSLPGCEVPATGCGLPRSGSRQAATGWTSPGTDAHFRRGKLARQRWIVHFRPPHAGSAGADGGGAGGGRGEAARRSCGAGWDACDREGLRARIKQDRPLPSYFPTRHAARRSAGFYVRMRKGCIRGAKGRFFT